MTRDDLTSYTMERAGGRQFFAQRRVKMSFIAGVVLFVVVVGLVDRRLPWPSGKDKVAGKW